MAFDSFLKIDTIDGDSQVKGHEKEIELYSFSWGVSNAGARGGGGGGGAGRASFQDIHFAAAVNVASPVIMKACASGQHFKKAVLTCRKAGGEQQQEFLKYTFTDCIVSSYANGSNALDHGFSELQGNQDVPSDQFSLNFRKVEMLFTSQRPDGTVGDAANGAADAA